MQSFPTTDEWLSMPRSDLANLVYSRNLAVLLSLDGTRRHYLLHTAEERAKDFDGYIRHCASAYVRVYELLFALGIRTIMTPLLYPPNFARDTIFIRQAVAQCRAFLANDPFLGLYTGWQVRSRLYGDYDISPAAALVRHDLTDLAATLVSVTPHGERCLLFGFNAGSFTEELIARTLAMQTGHPPTEEVVRRTCFPNGPSELNILIEAGWLRVGMILPPLLDGGRTDLYNLAFLALDLQEQTARQILYDHLFRRWAASEDDVSYTQEDLQALSTYYREHAYCLQGLGQLVGPGLWYPDHPH